ncbi:glyoxalase [Bacillus sp. FJAT-42376]|uniref:VOC family protein n=1 Tax=Bacillus sp. FJAT-42376 TaxID=2014076 RepID=UPI000F504118|nr:VOC family protein [Bacillus sp. FJAT-42376]AZB42634.1 glyoxalase [Bacillus sp. FJAT-42376]
MNSLKFIKMDHVQICVPSHEEAAARAFYLDLLGFNEIPKPDSLKGNGGFWCSAGAIEVHIGLEEMDPVTSKRHPAFEIGNLDAARILLENAGVGIKEEKPIPGRDRFSFADPFGNRIELLQYKTN